MKKILVILVTVVFVGLIGSQAWACMWDGYWGGYMGGPMGGYGNSLQGGANQGFFNDTAQLRQDLAAKQGEYNALMAKSNPDPKRAADVSRQITSLHDQLQSKAQAYNLPAPGAGYGSGPMFGNNRMGGGYGWCW
jgi:zinc resistance-associated protein